MRCDAIDCLNINKETMYCNPPNKYISVHRLQCDDYVQDTEWLKKDLKEILSKREYKEYKRSLFPHTQLKGSKQWTEI